MPQPTNTWKVYYADGSVFSSDDGSWDEAPDEGVQVVLLFYTPPYREMVLGFDSYVIPGETKRLQGSLMEPESEFDALQARAFADMDWPS